MSLDALSIPTPLTFSTLSPSRTVLLLVTEASVGDGDSMAWNNSEKSQCGTKLGWARRGLARNVSGQT